MDNSIRARVPALLAVLVAASPGLMAQPDGRQIIEQSIAAADRSWAVNHSYTYIESDEVSHFEGERIKSTDVQVLKAIIVDGDTFEETVSHNGKPPTAEKIQKEQDALRRRQNETPQTRADRLNQEKEDRAFIAEVPDAFEFRLLGEETIDGRTAYILEAVPKPGYRSHTKYGKMFSKVRGKLWVDKQDFGWVKVEAVVTESFPMGFFVARVQPGTHITFQQTRVADGIWLPKLVEVKADAKIFFVKNYRLREVITYSDYHLGQPDRSVPESVTKSHPVGS